MPWRGSLNLSSRASQEAPEPWSSPPGLPFMHSGPLLAYFPSSSTCFALQQPTHNHIFLPSLSMICRPMPPAWALPNSNSGADRDIRTQRHLISRRSFPSSSVPQFQTRARYPLPPHPPLALCIPGSKPEVKRYRGDRPGTPGLVMGS